MTKIKIMSNFVCDRDRLCLVHLCRFVKFIFDAISNRIKSIQREKLRHRITQKKAMKEIIHFGLRFHSFKSEKFKQLNKKDEFQSKVFEK